VLLMATIHSKSEALVDLEGGSITCGFCTIFNLGE